MKTLHINPRQILRAVQGACLAFFFAACGHAAAQTYTPAPNGYTVNGSTVTGSGTNPNAAYFQDLTTAGYTVTIQTGANLGNTTALGDSDELQFDHGSVTNHGTLTASGYGIVINAAGTVTNSGSITGTDSGVYIGGNGSVTNTGTISGTYEEGVYAENDSDVSTKTSFSLTNSGTISSADSAAFYLYGGTEDEAGTAANSNIDTVQNSGTLESGEEGIYVDELYNYENTGTGANLNKFSLNNTGTISSNDEAVYLDEIYNYDSNGAGTNQISLVNSGTITSGDEAIYLEAYNEDNAGNNVNTVSLKNSGLIESTDDYAIELDDIENDDNAGNGTNTITISNSGAILADDDEAVELDVYNDDNGGNGVNTIHFTNSGTITALDDDGVDLDEIENDDNTGNATNTVVIKNSGTILSEDESVYIDAYNDDNGGNGLNTVVFTNTGAITATDEDAVELDDAENDFNGGNGTNKITVSNQGSINAEDDAMDLFAYNYNNDGSASTSYTFGNSGTITSTDDEGVYLYSENEDNGGSGTNSMVFTNHTGGMIVADDEAIDLENYNEDNAGTAVNSNTISLTNGGTALSTSTSNYGAYLFNLNVESAGNATNHITIVNTGTLTGHIGLTAENENDITAGNSTNTIRLTNSGTITGTGNDAVDLENEDDTTTGTVTESIKVNNTATGRIFSTADGLLLTNTGTGAGSTVSVVNAGTIVGTDYGIDVESNNGTVLTEGGTIAGGDDAIVVDGTQSSVTILGRTNVQGTIEGVLGTGNVLNFDLAGLTPAQIVAAKAAIAAAGGGPGSFTAAGLTYNFDGFPTVNFNGLSFEQSVDSGLSSLARRIDNNPLPGAYDIVYSDGFSNPEGTLTSLSGREFYNSFRDVGLSDATAFWEEADSRAFDLRTGASGLDFSRMNVSSSSMIASLGDTQSVLGRMSSAVFGGTEMSDSKDTKTVAATPPSSRWGAWVSGTVTFDDESGTPGDPGYNATSGSPTIGADYRLCPDLVVGALFNYTTGNVDFDDHSNLDSDTYLLGAYADWAHGPWFVNGLVAGGYSSYNQSRKTLVGSDADASPDGDEVMAALSGGYDFKVSGWVVSPEAGLQYTHLTKDGYNETGGGAFNLNVGDEDVDSLRTKLGVRATHLFTFQGLKLTPEVNADWYHECFNDVNGVNNSLPGAPAVGSFLISTSPEGRDFALVGAGLSAVPAGWHDNVSFFVNYDAQVGENNFIAHTVDGGVRVNF